MAQSFESWTAVPIDTILKSGMSDDGAAAVRPWWPASDVEWTTADPVGYWASGEIGWESPQLFAPPLIVSEKLRWSNFQFDRTQAIIYFPGVFQNAPQKKRGRRRRPSEKEKGRRKEAARKPMTEMEKGKWRGMGSARERLILRGTDASQMIGNRSVAKTQV